MSVSEASGQDLNPPPTTPGRRRNFPNHLSGTLNSDIPTDPLLQSGSFIDASPINGQAKKKAQKPQRATEKSKRAEPVTPGSGQESSEGTPGRVKRKPLEPVENWLPQGWMVEERVRTSGATAGSTDRYYIDPVSGRRFRSKTEVLYFLETGTLKKKKIAENASADKTQSGQGSESHKPKKSNSKGKSSSLKFDFVSVPEMVGWVLADSTGGSWTPFVDNKKVPESATQEWAAAFTFVTARK